MDNGEQIKVSKIPIEHYLLDFKFEKDAIKNYSNNYLFISKFLHVIKYVLLNYCI